MQVHDFYFIDKNHNLKYIALYGTIHPSGPTPFADKIVEIVIDEVKGTEHAKQTTKTIIRFVYQSLCRSAFANICLAFPDESMTKKSQRKHLYTY